MKLTREQLKEAAQAEVKSTITEERMKAAIMNKVKLLQEQMPPAQAMEAIQGMLGQVEMMMGQTQGIMQSLPGMQEFLGALMQHFQMTQEQEAQAAQMQDKQAKQEKLAGTQQALAIGEQIKRVIEESHQLDKLLNEQSVEIYETVAKLTYRQEVNIKDIFNNLRAVEGVTVVSTEVETQDVGPTLAKSVVKIKFMKGKFTSKHYLSLLARAALKIPGVEALTYTSTRKLRDV